MRACVRVRSLSSDGHRYDPGHSHSPVPCAVFPPSFTPQVKTLELDLQTALKEASELREANLKLARKDSTATDGADAAAREEEDEDEKAKILVLSRSDTGNPQIRGGTPKCLVKRLTLQKYPDPEYMPAFLLTYRSFMTPEELLSELMAAYTQTAPAGLSEAEAQDHTENVLKPIRLRVFNVLKNWVEKHFYDFANNADLKAKLADFTNNTMKGADASMAKLASNLSRTLERRDAGEEDNMIVVKSTTAPPKPILPKALVIGSVTFGDLHPMDVARHLTLIEFGLFREIQPTELMGQAWNKKNKDERARNIVRMIHRYVCLCVCACVCEGCVNLV